MTYNEDYDPGFLNVPGFGQSAANPLSPVFIQSLGVVENLSVYDSVYCSGTVSANLGMVVGDSLLTPEVFNVGVLTLFEEDAFVNKSMNVADVTNTGRLKVKGVEYREQVIKCDNGTFTVLARV